MRRSRLLKHIGWCLSLFSVAGCTHGLCMPCGVLQRGMDGVWRETICPEDIAPRTREMAKLRAELNALLARTRADFEREHRVEIERLKPFW